MNNQKDGCFPVSVQTFRRLPHYYEYLKMLRETGVQVVASPTIAKDLRLNEVQVRKDMAAVSESGGKPRTGFPVEELMACIERCLGYDNTNEAVLVGVGKLGSALLSYNGFQGYGMRILAAFDNDARRIGEEVHGKPIFSTDRLPELCGRLGAHIGIITVPAPHAQEACDRLVASGILAIWNFAPVHLRVPEQILVQNEDMALSLAFLSHHLQETMSHEQTEKEGIVS